MTYFSVCGHIKSDLCPHDAQFRPDQNEPEVIDSWSKEGGFLGHGPREERFRAGGWGWGGGFEIFVFTSFA